MHPLPNPRCFPFLPGSTRAAYLKGVWSLSDHGSLFRKLFLEEIFECLARVGGTMGIPIARRRGSRRGRRRRCVFFHGCPERIKRAVVPRILLRNAVRNLLRAFETSAGIEIHALFAGMQFKFAAGALRTGVEALLQHSAAIRAACKCDRADHARSSRAYLLLPSAILLRTLFFLFRGIGVHVAPMTILPLQRNLRGDHS